MCVLTLVGCLKAFTMSSTMFMTEQATDRLPCHPSIFSLWFSPSYPLWVFIKETESWRSNSWLITCCSYPWSFHIQGPLFPTNCPYTECFTAITNAWLRTDATILVLVWTQRSLWSMLLQCAVNPQVFRIQRWYERHFILLWVNIILLLFKLQSLKRKDKSCATKARFLKIDDLFWLKYHYYSQWINLLFHKSSCRQRAKVTWSLLHYLLYVLLRLSHCIH